MQRSPSPACLRHAALDAGLSIPHFAMPPFNSPLAAQLALGKRSGPSPAGLPSPCCHTPDGLDPCRGTLHCPFVSHFRTSRLSSRRESLPRAVVFKRWRRRRPAFGGARHPVLSGSGPHPNGALFSRQWLWFLASAVWQTVAHVVSDSIWTSKPL
jgi:hypothetical protein